MKNKFDAIFARVKELAVLFLAFLKIGAITFGGGYAMIAILESELCEKKKWVDSEEFLDMVAISESTPGPVAINMATYIGYNRLGILGSVAATAGVVLPSLTIIYLISLVFDFFLSLKIIAAAFKGIQICVIYLISSAGIRLIKKLKKTSFSVFTVFFVCAMMIGFSLYAVKFSSIVYILMFGIASLVIYLLDKYGGAK